MELANANKLYHPPDPMIGYAARMDRLIELAEAQLAAIEAQTTATRAVRAQLVAVQAELSAVARHLAVPPPGRTGRPRRPPEPQTGP